MRLLADGLSDGFRDAATGRSDVVHSRITGITATDHRNNPSPLDTTSANRLARVLERAFCSVRLSPRRRGSTRQFCASHLSYDRPVKCSPAVVKSATLRW